MLDNYLNINVFSQRDANFTIWKKASEEKKD